MHQLKAKYYEKAYKAHKEAHKKMHRIETRNALRSDMTKDVYKIYRRAARLLINGTDAENIIENLENTLLDSYKLSELMAICIFS